MAMSKLRSIGLLPVITDLSARYGTTGADLIDYWQLVAFVRDNKPKYFLECGTGITTHIIAWAMKKYCQEQYNGDIRLVSMESIPHWHEEAMRFFPDQYRDFLTIEFSPIAELSYHFFTGICYQHIPDLPYSAIYVDGPDPDLKDKKDQFIDMDFLRVVLASTIPVSGMIDKRKATGLFYSTLFGPKKVKYFRNGWGCDTGYIYAVTNDDLLVHSKKLVVEPAFATIPQEMLHLGRTFRRRR
jgi:hypothetical protein